MSATRRSICLILCILISAAVIARPAIARQPAGGAPPNGSAAPNGVPTPPPVPQALATPSETLRTFMEAMQADPADFDGAIQCLDLSDVPEDAGKQIAVKLYGCIIRIEDVADESRNWELSSYLLPRRAERSLTFFPRDRLPMLPATNARHKSLESLVGSDLSIVLAQNDAGAWLFSAKTVADVEELYELIKDEPIIVADAPDETELSSILWLESRMPDWAMERVFGLKYWQWLGLLTLIFIGIILDFSVRFWIRWIARRAIHRRGGEVDPAAMRRIVRPFGLAVMALFWLFLINLLTLPPSALAVLLPAVRLFVMLAMVWALFRLTDLGGELATARAAKTVSKFDDLLIPLVRKTVKIFIAVFGLIYIADSLNVSIVPLLTGLGIGGVGFAFAAKDTLEHFFGSVTVIADRPFQVGDWVVIGDTEGTVEEVGFRSTRVRTFYNSLVTVPNGNLVRAVVDNYGKRKYRRWKTHLNLTYDTPPDNIEAFCEGIRELVRLHPYTRTDYYQVWLHQFGPHSLDVLVYVFWQTPDWQTELRERHRFMLDIIRLADRLGVEFAFPTQTLHMFKEEPGGEHSPEEPPESRADIRAQRTGRNAARDLTANARWKKDKPGAYRFLRAADTAEEDDDDETQIESKIGGDG